MVLFRLVFCLAGDSSSVAVSKTAHNAMLFDKNRKMGSTPSFCAPCLDIVRWDCTRLPLRDGIITKIVTDMPFGKRSGTRKANAVM
jgi:hypothetical protein